MIILLTLCHYLHLLLLDVHAICDRMCKKDYMNFLSAQNFWRGSESLKKTRPFALISYSRPTLRLGVTAHGLHPHCMLRMGNRDLHHHRSRAATLDLTRCVKVAGLRLAQSIIRALRLRLTRRRIDLHILPSSREYSSKIRRTWIEGHDGVVKEGVNWSLIPEPRW